MNKFYLSLVSSLLTFSMIATIVGCKSDNSTNTPTVKTGEVTAQIQESVTLDFSSTNTVLNNLTVGSDIQRTLSAQMSANSKMYMIILSVMDKSDGNKSFKIDVGEENQASFSISGDASNAYTYFPVGEITLTELSDKTWVGSFHFDEKCGSDTTRKVKVINGKINVKK